jgi:ABC-type dipeptide/oligopeptide/nickel transport system ATPase component
MGGDGATISLLSTVASEVAVMYAGEIVGADRSRRSSAPSPTHTLLRAVPSARSPDDHRIREPPVSVPTTVARSRPAVRSPSIAAARIDAREVERAVHAACGQRK